MKPPLGHFRTKADWARYLVKIGALYTRAEIDPRAAGDTESDVGRVRLLGYRVGAPNAGLPAGKNAYCQTRFLRCKKSRRVETRLLG